MCPTAKSAARQMAGTLARPAAAVNRPHLHHELVLPLIPNHADLWDGNAKLNAAPDVVKEHLIFLLETVEHIVAEPH